MIESGCKRKWLEEHDRLHRLFVVDRLSFERERKRLIDETINWSQSKTGTNTLRELQNKWDAILRHACSEHNRFILIQMLFWEQVRNVWLPALKSYEQTVKEAFIFPLKRKKHLTCF